MSARKVSGPALTVYYPSLYLVDEDLNPIIDGSASLVITDQNGVIILPATDMPQLGTTAVYRVAVAASVYVRGTGFGGTSYLRHTLTGKDSTGAVQATRIIDWTDDNE